MPKWVKIDNYVKEIAAEPWSMYWTEWKSGTKEFNDFLLNPIEFLSTSIDEVGRDFKVSTEILNHEIGLLGSAVCTGLMVMPASKLVKMTLYKH